MEHQRERQNGAMEVGYVDATADHANRPTAHHAAPPQFLVDWEDRRPKLLAELFAEFLGVFTYVYCGVGATGSFYFSSAAKVAGFGSLLNIALSYMIGIILAIVIAGSTSGGHLSPAYTIAFWLFKGFPARKVLPFIAAQIFGGFVAAVIIYGVYAQQFNAVAAALTAAGEKSVIFSPLGPGGVLALFKNAGQGYRYVFLNEFIANVFLSIVVASVLDSSNVFVSFSSAPFLIGIAYAVMIMGFAADSLALNSARDIGGRLACATVYGVGCFNADPKYTAIAALTNIPATLLGVAIQTFMLSDSARPIVSSMPAGPSLRVITRDASLHQVSRGHSNEKNV